MMKNKNIFLDFNAMSVFLVSALLVSLLFSHAVGVLGVEGDSGQATSTPLEITGDPGSEELLVASGEPALDAQVLDEGYLAGNFDTGAGSDNEAVTDINNETTVTNLNNATTTNNSYLASITGLNIASFNTGSGVITTEDAKGQGEIVNVINRNEVQTADGYIPPVVATNDGTGTGSDNLAEVNLNNKLTVHNINHSNTINVVEAKVISGQNDASRNTEHGIVLTGDADLGFNFITMANTNLVGSQRFYADWQNIYDSRAGDIDLAAEAAADLSPLSDLLIEASNSCTGADSQNHAIVNVNDETTVINQNSGKINNEINAKVISGQNKASKNTGSGSVATGEVNSAINVVNFLNSNINSSNWWMKTVNVFGDWTGNIWLPKLPPASGLALGVPSDVEIGNSETGFDSDNETFVDVASSVAIDNDNEAVITNNLNVKTNTGNNNASYNGRSGVIKLGGAEAETNEINVANLNITGDSWWLVVVNKFGEWNGTTIGSPADMVASGDENVTILSPFGSGIKVANSATGPESDNIAGVNINHSTDLINSNNADIINNVNLEAISGENEALGNTGHGYIEAGDIRATNNIVNFANANITAGNWMVAVVNVFGNWMGNVIFGAEGEGPSSQSIGGTGSVGNSSATNETTGTASDNAATTGSDSQTDVTNTNNSKTTNNASASSSTGENSASGNTGDGVVSTGEAQTGNSVGNEINSNSVGLGVNGGTDVECANDTTGAGSDNECNIINTDDIGVDSNNNIVTENNAAVANTTGGNSSDYNTGPGAVDTGWASAFLDLYNQQNSNEVTLGEFIDEITPDSEEDEFSDWNISSSDTDGGLDELSTADSGVEALSNGNYQALSAGVAGNQNSVTDNIRKKGDLNGDGKVDDYDFSILMAHWGAELSDGSVDTNLDGVIDDRDFSIVMSNWGGALAVAR